MEIEIPPLNLSHLFRLTDETGIFQHAKFSVPNPHFGYTTDDNARALVAVIRLLKKKKDLRLERLIPVFLRFLLYAYHDGKFHNFLGFNRCWEDKEEFADCGGRALWALAVTSTFPSLYQKMASVFFDETIGSFKPSALRTKSYLLLALTERLKVKEDSFFKAKVKELGEDLIHCFQKEENWSWFGEKITHDNGRFPQALLSAYQALNDRRFLKVGLESLDFLLQVTFDKKKNCFSFIGHEGWRKGEKRPIFDQQPIEAGSIIEACLLAYQVTEKKFYWEMALAAFQWFFGRNIHNLSLYNPKSGGVRDALMEKGMNLNEGAEALLSLLLVYPLMTGS